MKYLKSYKQVNEGLRDKMTPVSKEEILGHYYEIKEDKSLINLLKYVFDNNLYIVLPDNEKKELIDRIYKGKKKFEKFNTHKNLLSISDRKWPYYLFFNTDNYNARIVGLYAAREAWETITELV